MRRFEGLLAVSDAGAEVLDVSADADHNRAVVTYVGTPGVVEEASVSAARVARPAPERTRLVLRPTAVDDAGFTVTRDGERFRASIAAIRDREPEAVFRSNFIVGYPGETEDDHDQLLAFVDEAQLDWCGFFAYSREDGTYAADLDGQVEPRMARRFESHIAICANCRAYLDQYTLTVKILQEEPPLEPPPDLVAMTLAFLEKERTREQQGTPPSDRLDP